MNILNTKYSNGWSNKRVIIYDQYRVPKTPNSNLCKTDKMKLIKDKLVEKKKLMSIYKFGDHLNSK